MHPDQVQRAHRTDGAMALNRATMLLESCRADLATFTGCEARVPAQSGEGYYTVAVNVSGTGTSYSLTATAIGNQADDTRCTTLTLNSQGTEGHTGTAADAATCWGK